MPRRPRNGQGGLVFHVFNRAATRAPLFGSRADYRQFEEVLIEGCTRASMRVLAYCVMPNHWHLLLWPRGNGDLSAFMRWTTTTHAVRWRMDRCTVGEGAVYQGRYRAVPVQDDRHLLIVARYIERNPVRAGLVRAAADWPWSSAASGGATRDRPPISEWPLPRPSNWATFVSEDDPESTGAVRLSLRRALPFGDEAWRDAMAGRLSLGPARGRGRPQETTDCRK